MIKPGEAARTMEESNAEMLKIVQEYDRTGDADALLQAAAEEAAVVYAEAVSGTPARVADCVQGSVMIYLRAGILAGAPRADVRAAVERAMALELSRPTRLTLLTPKG